MRNDFFRAYGLWHCGEGVQTILLMWYMAFHARLSPAEIGFYQALQLAPFLMFTALGGSLTDRIGPRTSFAAATGSFALTLALYGLSDALIGFHGPLFAGYCLLSGLLSALANPAIDCFIPEATPRSATGNALLAATVHNLAKLSGNSATLLLPVISAIGGFALNGLLMAGSALFLLRHNREAIRPPRPAAQGRVWTRLTAHFRAYPASFDILLSSAMLGLLLIPGFYVFHPLTLREWFPGYSGLMRLTGMVGWVAAILVAALATRAEHHIRWPGRLALLVWSCTALGLMALTLVDRFSAFLAVLFVLGTNGLGKALIYGHYLRDAPARDRALLIGIDQTCLWGLATLGTFGLGWLVGQIGLAQAILADAGLLLASVAVLALRGHLWRLPGG